MRQRHWMRKDPIDVVKGRRDADQVVPDAQLRLAHHLHVVLQQEVEVFQHRSGKAVLNGNDRAVYRFVGQRVEDIGRNGARHDHGVWQHRQRCFVTE